MDAGVWYKIGLELGDVHIYGAIKAERCGEGGDDLGDEAVEVGVGRSLYVKGSAADIIDCLIVQQHGDICVLEQGVG